jgi:hypothetical protein
VVVCTALRLKTGSASPPRHIQEGTGHAASHHLALMASFSSVTRPRAAAWRRALGRITADGFPAWPLPARAWRDDQGPSHQFRSQAASTASGESGSSRSRAERRHAVPSRLVNCSMAWCTRLGVPCGRFAGKRWSTTTDSPVTPRARTCISTRLEGVVAIARMLSPASPTLRRRGNSTTCRTLNPPSR